MMHTRAMTGLLVLLAGHATSSNATAGEMLPDPAFAQSSFAGEWWATPNIKLDYKPGALCGLVAGGSGQPWDAILGFNGLSLEAGERYRLTLVASAAPGGPMRALVQKAAEPWTAEGEINRRLAVDKQSLSENFLARQTHPEAQLVFQLGGADAPWRFCLHSASLQSGLEPASAKAAEAVPAIRVNQLGYFPDGPKRATLVRNDNTPVEWTLLSATGATVASGRSKPLGHDASSGLNVHTLDFSTYRTPGEGYRLVAGGETSPVFAISATAYGLLREDALSYFYKLRSGIEISEELAGKGYGRPAGHVGIRPNRGDTAVGCVDTRTARKVYGKAWSCGYKLNVAGGWYDAGDFGKYVVNGGIATAQLLASYERALNHGGGGSAALTDNLVRIPEAGNGVADILDEARWELDFLISMMVPEGEALAGMAHHKVHGNRWTVGPILPHRDREERVLHRPSTAATLNLAAAAAQGARLFAAIDKTYAKRLLAVAERAFRAAEANPALYAPSTNGSFGGGDYEDDDVSDEFYWAAAELYLSTGDRAWLERAKASPHWSGQVFHADGFNWRSVAGLARLQLASVPSDLPQSDLKAIRSSVTQAADSYLKAQTREAFGFMYRPEQGFGWGSNHSLIENMIVVATAYDITGDRRYLQAVRESMDYILGRNALGISYVTGYGTTYAHRQYSNIFAASTDPFYPPPPDGALAGGPNSGLADDYAIGKLTGCAPQACYVDDARSYSTNEIAINWNAPLVWIASFLADAN
ncbi:glycoside hydrolase family 9 protein [Hoeflea sp. YIM 152468]|uniref:glycoside hydrolase family 9 protein n=1 Tax=Hoeflea sp. YIM 152468 TaxID=3031759 RepID=UPI0023DC08E6|nr:glycoside hydrolase family 9 protein [Hoeflea sp. YIM 152468]MDF1609770.1 glycoside hydrolase family 9 protein [Hoeflea sp. YIM 152468]